MACFKVVSTNLPGKVGNTTKNIFKTAGLVVENRNGDLPRKKQGCQLLNMNTGRLTSIIIIIIVIRMNAIMLYDSSSKA